MRTDTQKQTKSDMSNSDNPTECKEAMKSVRKSLHPLQVAAGDKENLVGAGRMLPTAGDKDSKVLTLNSKPSTVSHSPKKEKKKTNKNNEKKTITVEDLTSEEGPSEHYWQVLAETRRKALENALSENQQLHERVGHLTGEIEKYKSLLDEAQEIIDTLNEVITEINEDDSSVGEDAIRRP